MRVLVLANDFPTKNNEYTGLIFVKEQVKELAKLVDEINVVVPIPRGIEKFREHQYGVKNIRYENYTIGDNVNVYFVKYWNPLFPVTFYKFRKEWLYLETRAIMRFLRKEDIKFDVIHAHYSWPCGALGIKLKEEYNIPVVITEHTSQTLKRFIEKRDAFIFNVWRKADAIIRVRKGDINLISQAVNGRTPVFYIPNGFDGKKFRVIPKNVARETLKLPKEKRIILNVAQMYSPLKGHEFLIKAFSKVLQKQNDVLLVLVGDGRLRPKIESLIHELNVQDHVVLAGARPHDEIPLWMNAADLFVLPSLSEGNPTVMFEALGVGLPFVGTAVGGVPEIITSEDYGLLCPPADPECLAEKILIALEKEWDREKIRKYAEQFTWEEIAKRVINIYLKYLKK